MMADRLSEQGRRNVMRAIRSTGNKTTEGRVEAALVERGIGGWVKHPKGFRSPPDFLFPDLKLALYLDGCFWHNCPSCKLIPTTRAAYWWDRLENNRKRDNRNRRKLRRLGYNVMRIWEHDLRAGDRWLARLTRTLARLAAAPACDCGGGAARDADGAPEGLDG